MTERTVVAGRDYPATLQQLSSWFHDEQACHDYLVTLRWPEGFVCPLCGSRDAWRTGTGLWLCSACRKRTSVTAGAIFHRSRLPLTTWFAAAWLATADKNGVSALSLQRELGIASYESAWTMLHKLRRVMVVPGREKLSGLVEVGETYVGARGSGVDGRLVHGKAIVLVAIELREPRGFGRVPLRIVPEASQTQIFDFIEAAVAPGATVRTDGWSLYQPLPKRGYVHHVVSVKHSGHEAHEVLPGVHRVASLLERWLAGPLHSGVSHDHLESYLDEFTLRFNRRSARHRGLLFYRPLDQAIHAEPIPNELLVGGTSDHNILG